MLYVADECLIYKMTGTTENKADSSQTSVLSASCLEPSHNTYILVGFRHSL